MMISNLHIEKPIRKGASDGALANCFKEGTLTYTHTQIQRNITSLEGNSNSSSRREDSNWYTSKIIKKQTTNNKRNVFIFIQSASNELFQITKYIYIHTYILRLSSKQPKIERKRVTGTVSIFFIYKIQFKQSTWGKIISEKQPMSL